ncbi:MAG: hypothetical protein VX446_05185, partial [Bacteroidota bacterium]|nr:hypothetical protein [Bacteroidota bacterium]
MTTPPDPPDTPKGWDAFWSKRQQRFFFRKPCGKTTWSPPPNVELPSKDSSPSKDVSPSKPGLQATKRSRGHAAPEETKNDGESPFSVHVDESLHTTKEVTVVEFMRAKRRAAGNPVSINDVSKLKIDASGKCWAVNEFGILQCCLCVQGRRPHSCKCVCHDFHLSDAVSHHASVSFLSKPKVNNDNEVDDDCDDPMVRVKLTSALGVQGSPSVFACAQKPEQNPSASAAIDALQSPIRGVRNTSRKSPPQVNACRRCKSKDHSLRDCPHN